MHRMISGLSAAAVLVVGAVLPAIADDAGACGHRGTAKAVSRCYADLGLSNLSQGDYDGAIANYNLAIRFDPNNWTLHGLRGEAYDKKGDYDRAIADYNVHLRYEPNYSGGLVERGTAYFNSGNYDRAVSDYTRAIQLNPAGGTYNKRGEAYEAKHDLDHALADFKAALQDDPGLADAKQGVERVQALLANRSDHATPEASADAKVCEKPGMNEKAVTRCYEDRGWNSYTNRDYDRAVANFTRASEIDPKNWRYYGLRGLSYAGKRAYDRAIADYDVAIRLEPDDAQSYVKRGEAYEAMHDLDHASADFDRAAKLSPSLPGARDGLARVQPLLAQRSDVGKLAPVPAGTGTAPGTAPVTVAGPVNVVSQGRRIALVIGMSAYTNVPKLQNPVGDARAMADAFRRLGFAEVIEREDLTRATLEETLKEFGDSASKADWAVIYYAGHGIAMRGENYLIPVDAKLTRPEHVEDETVALKRVLSKAETASKLRMIILDACRNNPFPMATADGRTRGIARGLSPVEPASGMMVAYASRDGTAADDGDNGHSPFTEALLANIEKPNLDIRIMFSKVRDQVLLRTGNSQEPFTYGSLPGEELYFSQTSR